MSIRDVSSPDVLRSVLMGTNGTSGDLMYESTGSGMTLKSNADSGTDNTSAFLGILIDTTSAGSYADILCGGVVQLGKLATTNKIELGDVIYADGAASDNLVGTLKGGTAVGVCMKQSATTDANVSVKLIPFTAARSGFHA